MDFLKNEQFATPAVCERVQLCADPSPHKDSDESGQSAVVHSSDKGKSKDTHLSISDEVDSSSPKENFPHSVPSREKEGVPSSSSSSKNAVHFDKPNRFVFILCLEMCLSPGFMHCPSVFRLFLQIRCRGFCICRNITCSKLRVKTCHEIY